MSIKIKSYGGPIIWFIRKNFSDVTSIIMLRMVEKVRKKKINAYIESFLGAQRVPHFKFIMIETLNRCNGKCSFCPANIRDEKRPYKRMSEELFDKIVMELKENNWKGRVYLQGNNEPFIDSRICKFAEKIKENLPECSVHIITNGTLLNIELLEKIKFWVDEIIINDYGDRYRLSDNIKSVYRYCKNHKNDFEQIQIYINRRFVNEILSTRAGEAPNKPKKNNHIQSPCIYPFTDLVVYPDGKVGMCCNDCLEKTEFGDLYKNGLFEIWQGEKFNNLRKTMKNSRMDYDFCKECDVMDAGSRESVITI